VRRSKTLAKDGKSAPPTRSSTARRANGFDVVWLEVTMLRALVPVDGSDNCLAAIEHVVKLVQDREPLEIHLLNVQPPLHGDVTAFVSASAVKAYHHDETAKALAPACALLDAAAVPYQKHMVVGHAARVIAETAKKLGCDKVIMGTRGLGTMSQLLLGSVTHEAIHLMDPAIPVTLVKCAGHKHKEES
jgi:nucleotide-binding universal stress UspA family protein